MKLAINHKNKTKKHTKSWSLNNMLLNNEWVNNEIKKENNSYLETNENENTTTPKSMRYSKSSHKREIHSITGLPQETWKN